MFLNVTGVNERIIINKNYIVTSLGRVYLNKEFGYKGSDYRLKKSLEAAIRYTLPQLERCLEILMELDKGLKGSPVSSTVLLQTALCRLAAAGVSR